MDSHAGFWTNNLTSFIINNLDLHNKTHNQRAFISDDVRTYYAATIEACDGFYIQVISDTVVEDDWDNWPLVEEEIMLFK